MTVSTASATGVRLGDLRISSCCADSRLVRPGDLFVAIVGGGCDGHDFVQEAVRAGATAVLAERMLPITVPCVVVEDSRAAYGRICQALAGYPSRQLGVIGVTGTNGKTTTTHLIASVLAQAGLPAGICGTLGAFDGLDAVDASHTTPPAPVLARWLAQTAANGCTHAVMEVSSHALSQARTAGVEIRAACFTNIRRDHLDFHGTLENYRAAKARLLEHLAPGGLAVVNVDDPACASLLSKIDGPALTVGLSREADLMATMLERHLSEQTFLLTAGSETAAVRTRMIGAHHVQNCLVAAAVGLAHEIELPTIAHGLEAVHSVPGRLERIECGQGFGVFIDYAHTADGLASALSALRPVTKGRLICVFGAGGNRDRTKRPLMGQAVGQRADVAIVTTDNPRDEDPAAIAADIYRGLRFFADQRQVEVVLDRGEAIHSALSEARPGDVVLVAGKGHEAYQTIGGRRIEFDDRQVARELLYRLPVAQAGYRAAA